MAATIPATHMRYPIGNGEWIFSIIYNTPDSCINTFYQDIFFYSKNKP